MKYSVVITARNEREWPKITATNMKYQLNPHEVIGVDDGGVNQWGDDAIVYKTKGGVGVGICRRYGITKSQGDVLCIADGHVLYHSGDVSKMWQLAKDGYIVTFTTKSLATGINHGCGRMHSLPSHKAKNIRAKEGQQVGLVGGVYMMRKDIALDVVAPTVSHGFNEQIMTIAALAMGYPVYAFPEGVFAHLYKQKFNYPVTTKGQEKNRLLLDWWFMGGQRPSFAGIEQDNYYEIAQKKRILSRNELISTVSLMNTGQLVSKLQTKTLKQ